MYKFGVLACGNVGLTAIKLFKENPNALKFVVLDSADFWNRNTEIIEELKNISFEIPYFYEDKLEDIEYLRDCDLDLVISAFWGKIIKEPLLSIPRVGYLNMHTSFLPYSRGKHPHIWSIIEETPYGVTMHLIDKTLDTGPVIFQKKVPITWEDTGETIYFKGIKTLCDLITEKKVDILNLNFEPKQQIGEGTFHYAKELEEIAHIELEEKYTARNLLNILRAKTFLPFPAAYFEDEGEQYEVHIDIRKKEDTATVDYDDILRKNGMK